MPTKSEIHQMCCQVLDRFMEGLNAHDANAMDACMNFPHIRSAGGTITVYERPGCNPMDLFLRLKNEDGWSHSRWETRDVIQFNDTKAHVALSYTRFREDNSIIGVYESLYVLTKKEGMWGIQMRSSFGP